MNPTDYANAHREQFLEELKEFVRIPSISTLPDHVPDMRRAANWVADALRSAGLPTVEIYQTPGHPIVYGAWQELPDGPTVLIYGHYDVQPVDPLELWTTPPFEPDVRDGKLYARGATDDKGQVFAQIKAIDSIMKTGDGRLPINVKFLIEGEEEVGSANLDDFIYAHQDLLKADWCVISDGAVRSLETPSMSSSVRGLAYMEIEVTGPKSDLHSGGYGGTVHNPAQALAEIIAALHNPDGSVAVPGFYDKVRTYSSAEREEIARSAWQETAWQSETGAPAPWGEVGYSLQERVGIRPTLEVNGLLSGFTGKGAKTVLPAKALAKVSCRLVADQDPYEIEQLVRTRVQALTPPTVKSEVRGLNYAYPASVPLDDPAMDAASIAYERGFGAKPLFIPEGGTLPIVGTLRKAFGMPVALMGFGLMDDSAHAPNEKFDLVCFHRGINTAIAMIEELSKIPAKQ